MADVETSGISEKDGVCELAWIEINEDLQVVDRQYSLIDPQCPISATASGIHGITNRDVHAAPTMDEFFNIVLQVPLTGDIVFIAHNAEFDIRFFGPYIKRIAGKLCTLRLARRVWPDAENHKLQTLMYLLNLKRSESHRADGDAETCLELLRKIVEKTGKDLCTLASESMDPLYVKVMPFGKHKGSELKKLPRSYLNWLLGLDNLDRDMRYSAELALAGKAP